MERIRKTQKDERYNERGGERAQVHELLKTIGEVLL
jgi:hypothetical protein